MPLLVATACDNTFVPTDPRETPFSVFGYLDPASDTQWIRVNDLRQPTFRNSPDPTGSRVTLQDLATGETIELRDTALPYGTMVGRLPVFAHNFWTTERLEPGATYRFHAEAADGVIAESLVRIPPDYQLGVWVYQPTADQTEYQRHVFLRVEGVENLPFYRRFESPIDPCYLSWRCGPVQAMDATPDSGIWMIDHLAASYIHGGIETIASGDAWPFGQDYSVWTLGVDSLASNVTGAIGFLAGVLSKKIWAEDCALPYPSPPETYCKLQYDSTTATLRGRVQVINRLGLAWVYLRELEPPAGERPRTLITLTDTLANYELGAIRPGRHEITAVWSHCVLTDTLEFVAGQRRTYYPWCRSGTDDGS